MQIKSTLTDKAGQMLRVEYKDVESEKDFDGKKISGVHAFCFYKDKLVIVYAENKKRWGLPGGGVEDGEKVTDAVIREVKEETNMKVIKHKFIGYQDVYESRGIISQTRSVCLVEPYGDFVFDPDGGEVTEIKLIAPKDFKQYVNWGEVGDHLLERALDVKDLMKNGAFL